MRTTATMLAAMVAVIETAAAADVPGNTSTRAAIQVGQSYNGDAEVPGDADWYRIQLRAGQTYVINAREPSDYQTDFPGIAMRDNLGRLLKSGYGEVTAKRDGLHFVAVSKNYDPETSRDLGGYLFGVYGDCLGSIRTSCKATPSPRLDGSWDYYADIDYRAIKLQAGITYTLTTLPYHDGYSWWGGNLRLRDSTGKLVAGLAEADVGRPSKSFTFKPKVSGTYYIAAAALEDYSGDAVGAYAYSVTASR